MADIETKLRVRHPEKAHKPDNPVQRRKPSWIRVKAPVSRTYHETREIVREHKLSTVCEEAACPNIGECWSKKHATMMIMGEICTRACAFCNVRTGLPTPLDPNEPENVAIAVEKLGLLHVVITSVDRDDLPDFGAWLASQMIRWRGASHRSVLLDFLTVGVLRLMVRKRRTPFDWLSRDPAVVDAYIADPLCGNVPSVALWRAVYEGVRFIARREHQARIPRFLPILLLAGGADPLSGGGRSVSRLAERYRSLGIADVTCRIYPGARHEIFNEINRSEVHADLLDWLDLRLNQAAAPERTGTE